MDKEFHIQQLVSYITDNCSTEEQNEVKIWLKSSKDNQVIYDDFLEVWNSTSVKKESILVDLDNQWEDFKSRSSFNDASSIDIKQPSVFKRFINIGSSIAAAIVFLFTVFMMFSDKQPEIVNYYTDATNIEVNKVLPDGSCVNLNRSSNLDFPEFFTSSVREVSFNGEAFFNIAHNPDQPMIIATDNVRVKVLGTSFNLCNCDDSDEIVVYLETGKILFYSIDEYNGSILEQVILTPGEKGVYDKSTGAITKSVFSGNNHTAWKSGVLEFVNAPLDEVVEVLSNTYCIDITSDIQFNNYLLTARFENESPESILESLKVLYGFQYRIDEKAVSIY